MTYTVGYLRSGSSSYPGGRYTSSGRSCGSPSGLPRSNSLLMTCSSMRPARSVDQGSTAPPQAGRRAQTPYFHSERAMVRLPAPCVSPRAGVNRFRQALDKVPIGLARMTTGAPSGPSRQAARRTSDIEEDRLAVTLQPDVEPELPVRLGHRDERGPA